MKRLIGWLKSKIMFFLAKRFGEPFTGTDETEDFTMTVSGYRWRGCTYVTGELIRYHKVITPNVTSLSIGAGSQKS